MSGDIPQGNGSGSCGRTNPAFERSKEASTTDSEMTDDLQRQCRDPSGSGDATSPDITDPLDLGATYSNAEKCKMKANKGFEEFLSRSPGYHCDTYVEDPLSSYLDDECLEPLEPSQNKEKVIVKIELYAGCILSCMRSFIACNDLAINEK